jgi:hypothetical protein
MVEERGDLEERLRRLEDEVAALRSDLRRAQLDRAARRSGLDEELRAGVTDAPRVAPEPSEPVARPSFGLRGFVDARSGEWWLSRVGIGLLLFGVVFLFAYSVERGWIGPPARVAFGVALGIALLTAGLRVRRRPALSGALLGGGVAALYTSVFAAFQLYALLPHAAAFVAMVSITVLSFSLSLHRDDVTPALVGVLGGLGTPFLLSNGDGSLPGLVLYTCLILTGAAAVYLYKGWVPLALVALLGGWAVLGASLVAPVGTAPGDLWALQAGAIVVWLLFAVAPVTRVLALGQNAAPGFVAPVFALLAPLLSLGFSGIVWPLSLREVGAVSLAAAALYALAALGFRYARPLRDGRASRDTGRSLGRVHALVALLLLNLAGGLILRGDALFLALAAEAAALTLASRRLSDRLLSTAAHGLSLLTATWLLARLGSGIALDTTLDLHAATDLAALALLFAASSVLGAGELRSAYRVFAHLALLAWLWRVLGPSFGDAAVTVSWGLYAAGLLVGGLLLADGRWLVRLGAVTLCLVVAKLFLMDLAAVGLGTRVLLFLGLGILFLALGYYLGTFRRPAAKPRGDAFGEQEVGAGHSRERFP